MNKVLTDEEINAMAVACTAFSDVADHFVLDQESFARAIEAAVLAKFGEPVCWTLEQELAARETTCSGHLWFSDPQNCSWTPLYAIKKEGA